ncbi:YisL family protein [Mangrovibacillus cuniculi]|uniref:YisL family protein n=1 Tax=Mangrovibacillus cuniculi TaxID=2593652 RepID=A0A7S8CA50_9BACI|nr:YisL family protein [Mangrovibacillus cuniculi]QPC46033.1 YisL family protein [Mangrovibacillus cuniculi]
MATTHLHITTWALAIILYAVALVLFTRGAEKGSKITHMILRLMYILIIISGILIYPFGNENANHMMYGIKALSGIATITFFELSLVRLKKGKNARPFFIGLVVVLLVTIYLGTILPQGIWY